MNSVLICRVIQLQKKMLFVCFFLLVRHSLVFFSSHHHLQTSGVTVRMGNNQVPKANLFKKTKNQFFTVIQKCIIILSLSFGRYHFLNHKFPPPCPVSLLKLSVCNLGAHPYPDSLCRAAQAVSTLPQAILTHSFGTLALLVLPSELKLCLKA